MATANATSTTVLFEQPNAPQEFGVQLTPASLRNLDFSALDFDTLQRACIEYIRTYYSQNFNDFFASNGVIMLTELVSYIGATLAQRSDILVDESFLPTAQTVTAVQQHLALIDQKIARPTPAVVDVQCTVSAPLISEIQITAGTRFTLTGPDQQPLYYEIFRAPGDFTSPIIIPPGKRGIIAFGIEGITATPLKVTSVGGPNQYVDIPDTNVLDDPITVQVTSGNITVLWKRVEVIQTAAPTDKVFEVKYFGDTPRVVFGDNINGQAPFSGQIVSVSYRRGGGIRGRIASNIINETRAINPQPPISAAIGVLFQNPTPSSGGVDEETVDQARARAPLAYSTHNSVVTGGDYGTIAAQFNHPVYGSVAKAIGILRTGVDQDLVSVATAVRAAPDINSAVTYMMDNFINRNIVELYVLTSGPNNTLSTPNTGLKQGLITYLSELNVLTDEVRVFDGAIKPVNIKATVVISRNADAGTVQVAVGNAITNFFDPKNFNMGTGLYQSNLISLIQSIPGVKFVDFFSPADDILPTNQLGGGSNSAGVGFNEVIVLGEQNIQFYFEAGSYQ